MGTVLAAPCRWVRGGNCGMSRQAPAASALDRRTRWPGELLWRGSGLRRPRNGQVSASRWGELDSQRVGALLSWPELFEIRPVSFVIRPVMWCRQAAPRLNAEKLALGR